MDFGEETREKLREIRREQERRRARVGLKWPRRDYCGVYAGYAGWGRRG